MSGLLELGARMRGFGPLAVAVCLLLAVAGPTRAAKMPGTAFTAAVARDRTAPSFPHRGRTTIIQTRALRLPRS